MIKCALFYSVAEHVLGELLDEKEVVIVLWNHFLTLEPLLMRNVCTLYVKKEIGPIYCGRKLAPNQSVINSKCLKNSIFLSSFVNALSTIIYT